MSPSDRLRFRLWVARRCGGVLVGAVDGCPAGFLRPVLSYEAGEEHSCHRVDYMVVYEFEQVDGEGFEELEAEASLASVFGRWDYAGSVSELFEVSDDELVAVSV